MEIISIATIIIRHKKVFLSSSLDVNDNKTRTRYSAKVARVHEWLVPSLIAQKLDVVPGALVVFETFPLRFSLSAFTPLFRVVWEFEKGSDEEDLQCPHEHDDSQHRHFYDQNLPWEPSNEDDNQTGNVATNISLLLPPWVTETVSKMKRFHWCIYDVTTNCR